MGRRRKGTAKEATATVTARQMPKTTRARTRIRGALSGGNSSDGPSDRHRGTQNPFSQQCDAQRLRKSAPIAPPDSMSKCMRKNMRRSAAVGKGRGQMSRVRVCESATDPCAQDEDATVSYGATR